MKKTVSIALFFVLLCGLIWFVFAIIVASGLHPALPNSIVYKWIMAGLSFLSSLFLLFLYYLLRSRNKIGYVLTIAFLFFIAFLTIADDLGVVDFIVLLITIIPVILLIKDHRWFLHKGG